MSKPLFLDHYAFRVRDRDKALAFYETLGYAKQAEFELVLEDGSAAMSYALTHRLSVDVFISSGPEGSFIRRWVDDRGGNGAVHHMAYAVHDVAATMAEWKARGIEFRSEEPLVCSCERPIIQVFTAPDPTTGIIYELINRNGHPGFCPENVRRLMDSSPG